MTRHIGQAPQGNFNHQPHYGTGVNHQFQQQPPHPESVQDGFYQTPAHNGRLRDPLDQPVDVDGKKRKVIAIAAGSVVVAVAAVGAIGWGVKKGTEDAVENAFGLGNGDRNTTAPYNPSETNGSIDYSKVDPNTLTVDQFYDDATYPEAYRIRWANKIIQERATPQKIAEMNALMARANKRPLGEIVPASENNTGDQILAQQSLAGYIASTDPNPTTGRKLLAGFLSSENPGFEKAKGQIGGGQDPVAATYVVAGGPMVGGSEPKETPTFYQTAINGYTPNGIPSKFINIRNTVNNNYSAITVKFTENRWVTVNTISGDSPDWIMNPQNITVE